MKRKAQSSMEYMFLVVVVIGACLTIGTYFKRGIQGRWRTSVDGLGDQYDPLLMNVDIVTRRTGNTATSITIAPSPNGGFWTIRQDDTNAYEFIWGYERAAAF